MLRISKSTMKRHLFIALAVVGLALAGLALFCACAASSNDRGIEAEAAIVDQLYTLYPNQAFIEQTTQELEDYGFQVDVHRGDAITVDFYRQLPTHGYELIIFRVHSGLLGGGDVANKTWLFTSELYDKTRHVEEQLTGQLTYARTDEDAPWVFAVGAKFIAESMEGNLTDTAMVMMGCDCFHFEDMAKTFVEKGASTYLAWHRSVLLDYVDDATVALIQKLCSEKLPIEEAVSETMREKGPDPRFGAQLYAYPEQSVSKTLRQLIE
jgi:hypothetical protein